ncbi:hypothetical protein SAMN02910356_00400 [Selenomonas sp. GACV-9]|nr:hypothetical protein SAMN02910356_00400 [Selenomonas ruminantium]
MQVSRGNGFILGQFVLIIHEHYPPVSGWQGKLMIFRRVKVTIDITKVDKAPVQTMQGGFAIATYDVQI